MVEVHCFFELLLFGLVDSVEVPWSMYDRYMIAGSCHQWTQLVYGNNNSRGRQERSTGVSTFSTLSRVSCMKPIVPLPNASLRSISPATEVYGDMPKQDLDAVLKRFKES